jgi:hypothetical protein
MNGEEKEGDPIEDTGDPLFGADEGADTETGGGRAADDTPDEPTRKVIVRPDRIGRRSVRELEVRLSLGDYVTIPPLPEEVFLDEAQQFDPAWRKLQWQRMPGALRRSSSPSPRTVERMASPFPAPPASSAPTPA